MDKKHKPVSLEIYKDDILVYDSVFPYYDELWKENIEADYYDWGNYYTVKFQDGEAVVVLYGYHMYQLFNVAMIVEIVMTFLIFFCVVMAGIRQKMKYIRKLSEEIEILEGGNLEYNVTVKGNDELSVLAQGIDDMRQSFQEKTEQEAKLVQANQRMVTGMSHDLRTPLTSIMIYIEILKKSKYFEEAELKEYIYKIERQTYRMKQLADELFEYSLISVSDELDMEPPEPFESVFYDVLSEACAYLEQRGFKIELGGPVDINGMVSVNMDYVMRIFDNITSNIIKYAESSVPVGIYCVQRDGGAGLVFKNRKKKQEDKRESNHIGIYNIKNMMEMMGGRCAVKDEGEEFWIEVVFPVRVSQA